MYSQGDTGDDNVAMRASAVGTRAGFRHLIFSLLLNTWPVLLLVSQKTLVPIGYLLVGRGDLRYQADVFRAFALGVFSSLVLVFQAGNDYGFQHFGGYLVFLFAIPLINLSVRGDRARLVRLLAIFSVANAALGILIYFLNIDLSAYRGLNLIVDNEGNANRVYFESTSLIAVFSIAAFRGRLARLVATVLVMAYALLLAKSIFVIALYLLNKVSPLLFKSRFHHKLIVLAVGGLAIALGPVLVGYLRSDVLLSLGIKALQFASIMEDTSAAFFGRGWGYVQEAIVNSVEQPYQVEMQLPMLVQQTGFFHVLVFATAVWFFLRSISDSSAVTWCRWFIYLLIGFNNPWLFIPSWYLTAALMFSDVELKKQ